MPAPPAAGSDAVERRHHLRPRVRKLKEHGPRYFTLNLDQEARIITEVKKLDLAEPGPKGGPPRRKDAHRYALLFTVLGESGLRLSEALNLQPEDLVFDDPQWDGLIRLWRTEELKNGKARTVPMTKKCREALVEACEGRSGGPFSGLRKRRAQDIWRCAADAAGIKHKDCVIHCLRHTCATRLLKLTNNIRLVQEWLGHKQVTTTGATYAHVDVELLVAGAKALAGLSGT